jgi:hypothetical protein
MCLKTNIPDGGTLQFYYLWPSKILIQASLASESGLVVQWIE